MAVEPGSVPVVREGEKGYAARMRAWNAILVSGLLALAAVATACSSTGGPSPEQWSRSYTRRFERVWNAALASLTESGYLIEEQDPTRGYIRAESGEQQAYRRVVLEVFVLRKPESVRVDVQASGGAVSSAADLGRLSRPVRAFLDDLDARLRS